MQYNIDPPAGLVKPLYEDPARLWAIAASEPDFELPVWCNESKIVEHISDIGLAAAIRELALQLSRTRCENMAPGSAHVGASSNPAIVMFIRERQPRDGPRIDWTAWYQRFQLRATLLQLVFRVLRVSVLNTPLVRVGLYENLHAAVAASVGSIPSAGVRLLQLGLCPAYLHRGSVPAQVAALVKFFCGRSHTVLGSDADMEQVVRALEAKSALYLTPDEPDSDEEERVKVESSRVFNPKEQQCWNGSHSFKLLQAQHAHGLQLQQGKGSHSQNAPQQLLGPEQAQWLLQRAQQAPQAQAAAACTAPGAFQGTSARWAR